MPLLRPAEAEPARPPATSARLIPFVVGLLAVFAFGTGTAEAAPCDVPIENEILCENSKPGDPPSQWDVSGSGSANIQGFATDISVDRGEGVVFKVDTNSDDYRLDIYRMGYYDGDGARQVATVQPSAALPQNQPSCLDEQSTGLIDCGNWAVSASWDVPDDAVSGIYFAKLVREDGTPGASHIYFVVRDDEGGSALLFQTSDTTWQAYNRYGGNSLYTGSPDGRAYKVSYNRPFTTRGPTPEDDPFNAEYPMVRWLERNGYDVSYSTGVDSARSGGEILEHEAFLSVGHDEYWSADQRSNVTAARDAGVDLAFFSGNEAFWKTRWESSIDGSGTDYRTLVSYKETHADAKIDPAPEWTGTWRDDRPFNPEGAQPENALSGTIFTVNTGTSEIEVPAAEGKLRLWRHTNLDSLNPGQSATLGEDTLGYEWDEDLDNGARPPGLVRFSSATRSGVDKLQDNGTNYASGTATHHLTMYRADSGALVFGAGTVQWSWGLDGEHDRGSSTPDQRMQQATVNLLADMGVQPGDLQPALTAASASTDATAPSSAVTSPEAGNQVEAGKETTITGTADDSGGGAVGGVEVSVDGTTWHPAEGRANWSYSWTPHETGPATIQTRAVDDSGNIEDPGPGTTVEVITGSCPCSIWSGSVSPPLESDSDAVELGVKFRSDLDGEVTGLRFYKGPDNTGTHVGHLWSASGDLLAQATFTGESGSGWQEVQLDPPVAVDADTTYVASYHAPNGGYAATVGDFSGQGTDSPPLHALADGVDGPNGVYSYGPAGVFPTDSYNASNYWVDVVFDDHVGPDTTPPGISLVTPIPDSTDVGTATNITATFNESMDAATIDDASFQLRDESNAIVPATVGYSAATRTAILDPSEALDDSTTYTATIKGGPGGVTDVAGNPRASDHTWSFTTAGPPPPPPDEGPGGPVLVIGNSSDPFSRYYAEILRAEGLNEFNVTDLANVDASVLDSYDVVVLGQTALSAGQAQMLTDWVTGGGNLIAMRPDDRLDDLLGLSAAGSPVSEGYMKVDTGSAPGAGIAADTMQFHGSADRFATTDAATVASLYSDATTPTANPAVTLRSVGTNGGQAAAFTYDLARSIVYTRQGNPAWEGQSRDGESGPIRSDNLFFGDAAEDPQPDWVDRDKIAIPQADEQQRLLANLIGEMNIDRKPLPRFWYFPRSEKAVVVMTGDDHASGGTAGRFDQLKALSPNGCSVAAWECLRSTSYIYPDSPLTNSQAVGYEADGFEVALHATTGCSDFTPQSLEENFIDQLQQFADAYPGLEPPTTNRTHCIAWSDWASEPKSELNHNIRFDTNYYYWPPSWVDDTPGLFTGSGMPMRFADTDGSMIDVYQAPTQMTDESNQTYPDTADALLDRALGSEGYYGAFVANMHTDSATSPDSDGIIASAQAHGVPVVSSEQMLKWLDGRNSSSFEGLAWNGNQLEFSIDVGAGANGLQAMVPSNSEAGALTGVTRNGNPVATVTKTVKGEQYAFVDAGPGDYVATYDVDQTGPVISSVAADAGPNAATITWDTDEASDSRVDYGTSPGSLGSSQGDSGMTTSHSIELTGLDPSTTYHYRVTSTDAASNPASDPGGGQAPLSFTTPAAPDQTPPTISRRSPVPDATGVDAGVDVVVDFDEVVKPSTVDGSSVRLRKQGSGTDVPAAVDSAGSTVTLDPSANLDPGTTYGVTVAGSIEDASGNPLGADDTWSFTTGGGQPVGFTDKTTAHFAAGDPGSDTYVAETADGEVTLAPTVGEEFGGGPGLPAGWSSAPLSPGGGSAVSGGNLTTDGAVASTDAAFGPGVALEFKGVLGAAQFQHAGFAADDFTSDLYAMFSTGNSISDVRARTNFGSGDESFTVPGVSADVPHLYRIEWDPTEVRYFVDGNLVSTQSAGFGTELRPTVADLSPGGPALGLDWLRMSPYVGSGSFDSRVFDAGQNADWGTLSWSADTPAGTDVALSVRIGDTASPNGSWSAFRPIAASGDEIPGSSRYLQYRATLDSGDPQRTPVLDQVEINGAGDDPPTAVDDEATVAEDSGPAQIDVLANDTDGDGGPMEINSVQAGAGAHGTVVVDSDNKGLTYEPDPGYCNSGPGGDRATFTYGLNGGSVATVRVRVTCSDVSPPQTTIDSGPPASGWTNDPTPTFGFSSGEPDSSFECRVDGGSFGSCSSPETTSSLSDGSHIFFVRATDPAGNTDPTPAQRTFKIDTVAPSAAVSCPPAPAWTRSSPVRCTGSWNDPGPNASGIPLGGVIYALDTDPGPATSFAGGFYSGPFNVAGEGRWDVALLAFDRAGNVGSFATVTVKIDSTNPQTTIDSGPSASGWTNDSTPTFGFSSDEPSSSFECKVDGGSFGSCSSPDTLASLPNGTHTFSVRATDPAGNTDQSPAERSFKVDSTPPNVSLSCPPAPAWTRSSPVRCTGSWNDPGPNASGIPLGGVIYALDTDPGPATSYAGNFYSGPFDVAGEGRWDVVLLAVDRAGNVSSFATVTVKIDSTDPETTIDSGPSGPTNDPTPTFGFSSGEPDSSFECRVDGGSFGSCSSPETTSSLSDGSHIFFVRATDPAGNTDPTPAERSFTVATGP